MRNLTKHKMLQRKMATIPAQDLVFLLSKFAPAIKLPIIEDIKNGTSYINSELILIMSRERYYVYRQKAIDILIDYLL